MGMDLENQSFLEKSVTNLLDSLDYLGSEQQRMQYFERMAVRQQQQKNLLEKRRAEIGDDAQGMKQIEVTSQLDTLLIAKQTSTYCGQVEAYAGEAFGKVFLASGCAS